MTESTPVSYSPPATVRWIAVDDGIVLWDQCSNRYVDLNNSAAELWEVLSCARWAPGSAVHHLRTAYGIDEMEASRIVDLLLENLISQGALAEVGGDATPNP